MRKNIVWTGLLMLAATIQNEAPKDSGGNAPQESPKEGEDKKTEETETLDAREKDEYFGSTLHKESVSKAVVDGHIKLTHQKKTQKTRGKGSREMSYEWDDLEFVDTDGVLAFVGGDEKRLLTLLSDVASDMNQQMAWETLFELSDEDRLVRQAAKRIAKVLNISEEDAEIQVKKMIADKAKEVAEAAAKG
jgi:hypothetical protein